MTSYWKERVAIVLLLLAFYFSTSQLIDDKYSSWIFVLLTTHVISLAHFSVGGIYLYKSLSRFDDRVKRRLWFFLLLAIGIVGPVIMILYGQLLALFFFLMSYFTLHALLNECTLYERGVESKVNKWLVTSIMLMYLGASFLSLRHTASALTHQFDYIFRNDFLLQTYLSSQSAPVIGFWAGVILAGLSVIIAVYQCFKTKAYTKRFLLYLLGLVVLMVVSVKTPINYIYVFSSIPLFHYITWFWYFFKRFKSQDSGKLRRYIVLHLVILLPFLLVLTATSAGNWIDVVILNSYVMLTLGVTHVTTSFMGESWFKRRFMKIED